MPLFAGVVFRACLRQRELFQGVANCRALGRVGAGRWQQTPPCCSGGKSFGAWWVPRQTTCGRLAATTLEGNGQGLVLHCDGAEWRRVSATKGERDSHESPCYQRTEPAELLRASSAG